MNSSVQSKTFKEFEILNSGQSKFKNTKTTSQMSSRDRPMRLYQMESMNYQKDTQVECENIK